MSDESLPVSVSCSGRRGQPASTAKAPAPHPGPLLAPEQSHLWHTQQPRRGFPLSCWSTSCLSDWGEKQPHCLSLSLSLTLSVLPPFLESSPRAPDPGPPSVSRLVVWSAVFSGSSFRVTDLKSGCRDDQSCPPLSSEEIYWTASLQTFNIELSRLCWMDMSSQETSPMLQIQLCAAETLWSRTQSDFSSKEQGWILQGEAEDTDVEAIRNGIWSNLKTLRLPHWISQCCTSKIQTELKHFRNDSTLNCLISRCPLWIIRINFKDEFTAFPVSSII